MLLDIGRLHLGGRVLIFDMVGIRFGYVAGAEEDDFVIVFVWLKGRVGVLMK